MAIQPSGKGRTILGIARCPLDFASAVIDKSDRRLVSIATALQFSGNRPESAKVGTPRVYAELQRIKDHRIPWQSWVVQGAVPSTSDDIAGAYRPVDSRMITITTALLPLRRAEMRVAFTVVSYICCRPP